MWWAIILAALVATVQSDIIVFRDEPRGRQIDYPTERVSSEEIEDGLTTRLGLLGPALGLPAVPGLPKPSEQLMVAPSATEESLEPTSLPPLSSPPAREDLLTPQTDSGKGCRCVLQAACQPNNTDGSGLVDIRIVNVPPAGISCGSKEVYCCSDSEQTTLEGCGTSRPIPVPNVNLKPGQAQFGEFPWMAVFLGPSDEYLGVGALLDENHVLTAAHKVAHWPQGGKVRLGDWDSRNDTEPHKTVDVEVQWVKVHPQFHSGNLHNDVAVMRLAQPVQVHAYPHINNVCLPPHDLQVEGQRCLVSGWGKDFFGPDGELQYILKKVDVPVINSDDCEKTLRNTRLGEYFKLSRSSFVCAGGEIGKDACTGDGGAPLVCLQDGRHVVVGLVAWGIGCADHNHPGVYVNVPAFIPWILEQVQS